MQKSEHFGPQFRKKIPYANGCFMRITTAVIALTVWALCTIPARATDNRFIVKPGVQPDAPVKVLKCDADLFQRYVDTRTVPPVDQLALLIGVKFENESTKTATAVKFSFVFSDPFGAQSAPLYGINEGTYSPGAVIQPSLAWNGLPKGDSPGLFHLVTSNTTADEMTCYVQSVKFDDGTIWSAP